MDEVAKLLNCMLTAHMIENYAVFGAVAQMRYTEPVQFIPTFDDLTREAVAEAEEADLNGIPIRVVDAEHLAVIALKAGRAKDFARILALLEAHAVDRESIAKLAAQHGLAKRWETFVRRFDEE